MQTENKLLSDVIKVSGRSSFPGRVYGMYEWLESKNTWDISKEWLVYNRMHKLRFILSQI